MFTTLARTMYLLQYLHEVFAVGPLLGYWQAVGHRLAPGTVFTLDAMRAVLPAIFPALLALEFLFIVTITAEPAARRLAQPGVHRPQRPPRPPRQQWRLYRQELLQFVYAVGPPVRFLPDSAGGPAPRPRPDARGRSGQFRRHVLRRMVAAVARHAARRQPGRTVDDGVRAAGLAAALLWRLVGADVLYFVVMYGGATLGAGGWARRHGHVLLAVGLLLAGYSERVGLYRAPPAPPLGWPGRFSAAVPRARCTPGAA